MLKQLRAESAELENRFSASLLRFSSQKEDDGDSSVATIKNLRRENAALRKRLRLFVDWELRLNVVLLCRERLALSPNSRGSCVALKKLLTAEECHAIVQQIYTEIAKFSASGREGSISTGASVFGWTDQRRVDNGLLKFSLSKLNTGQSPEEVSAGVWALLTSPNGINTIISQSINMHSEVVQVVDHSNVVIYQERHVYSNAGGVPTVTVVRALVLLTVFATESGYIFVNYGLDPELASYQPNSYLISLPEDDTIVQDTWQPMFCWSTFDRVEGAPHQCFTSFVGTFPVEMSVFVSWAVEVLLLVLRVESILLGPQWILPQEEV